MESFSEHSKILLKNHLSRKLSRREVEVVVLVLEGKTNRDVANSLCVAEKTIKFHLTNIYKKLNISRRSQIIWTLPLSDFIDAGGGLSSRRVSTNSAGALNFKDIRSAVPAAASPPGGQVQANKIPAGCATVSDQVSDQEK